MRGVVRKGGVCLIRTFAISAPKTGATPVMVPTAYPTRRRPTITKHIINIGAQLQL